MSPFAWQFWFFVTRLGEAFILLPAAALGAAVLLRDAAGRRLVLAWSVLLAAAVLLTTVTKVAFIGWGVGLPQIDFTGISGHAMFAAAIYPVMLGALAPTASLRLRWGAVAAGSVLALLVGISRVPMLAHSWSEVVTGLALGAAVSAGALAHAPSGLATASTPLRRWAPVAAALWLAVLPLRAPASPTHEIVTRLALKLSGHEQPVMRGPWLAAWRMRQGRL